MNNEIGIAGYLDLADVREDQNEHGSRIRPFAHERSWSSGSEWVELPPSLAQKIHEVSQKTGLSMEGIVWEAVDFYVRQKMYDLVRLGT